MEKDSIALVIITKEIRGYVTNHEQMMTAYMSQNPITICDRNVIIDQINTNYCFGDKMIDLEISAHEVETKPERVKQ
jgi:hypothetical protein